MAAQQNFHDFLFFFFAAGPIQLLSCECKPFHFKWNNHSGEATIHKHLLGGLKKKGALQGGFEKLPQIFHQKLRLHIFLLG